MDKIRKIDTSGNLEKNNSSLEEAINKEAITMASNCDEISGLILNNPKFTKKADTIMSRLVNIIPDTNKLNKMDGRTSPFMKEIGHTFSELFQYVQNQISHIDYGSIQMIIGALMIQFFAFRIGTQSAEKIQEFTENLKSKLAFIKIS